MASEFLSPNRTERPVPPYSQAAENNKTPILTVLRDAFAEETRVLEIASGTGQHAAHFGRALPHLAWQPSDLAPNLDGIRERLAADGPANVAPPVELDVSRFPWPVSGFDGVFSANCLHIVSWPRVEDFFRGVGEVLDAGGTLCVYGPFKYGGDFTTESNARFDGWLKRNDPESGIRDFEAVDALARGQGMRRIADHAMPANNQLLVWRRSDRG